MSSQIPISLENFSQQEQRSPVINSPRSIEACRRQGIDPSELIIKTMPEIKQMFKVQLEERAWQFKWQHYEDRRQEKVRVLLEERDQIIKDMGKGLYQLRENYQVPKYHVDAQKLAQKEQKQIEAMKRRQQKEIDKMLDNDLEAKLSLQKQDQRNIDIRDKQLQQIEQVKKKKILDEQERLQKEDQKDYQDHLKNKAIADQKYQESTKIKNLDQWDAIRRKQERQIKKQQQAEEKQRVEHFEQQKIERQMLQEQLYEAKQIKLHDKEIQMNKQQKVKIKTQKELNQAKAEEVESRRQNVKAKLNEDLERQRSDFENKQFMNEERRIRLDQEKQDTKGRIENELQDNENKRNQIQIKNTYQEEQRRQRLLIKFEDNEDRRKILLMEKQLQLKLSKEKDQEMDEGRREQQRQHDKDYVNQINLLEKKQDAKQFKVMQVLQEKKENLDQHFKDKEMLRQDKKENLDRIQRMQEYQREKLDSQIKIKMRRADSIKDDRRVNVVERLQVQREIERQKQDIQNEMAKAKQGKIDINTVSQHYQRDRLQKDKRPKTAVDQSKPLFLNPQEKKTLQKKIEELKIKQNREILSLLEDEERAEYHRERLVSEVPDPADKKRFEKILGGERAISLQRLQQLNDKHETEVEKMKNDHFD